MNLTPDHNPERQLALEFIRNTGRHVFLTGKAGTGKTTFLHQLRDKISKRMVVVAPTGVAAINAGGMTIHSFFQLPFGPQVPVQGGQKRQENFQRFSRQKINLIRLLDLLIIDEISMVRADVLDGVDAVLRRFRDRNRPFGGVQLLMIGDLQQLPPVIKEEDWNLLRPWYDTLYFFGSRALKQTNYVGIELKHVYRQREQQFIELLNSVRNNRMDQNTLELLNSRHRPGFTGKEQEGYVTLTTHNHQARNINEARLEALKGSRHIFTANISGDFPEHAFPTDHQLCLKIGAQVMFVKNDPSYGKHFFNGKTGKLVGIHEKQLFVKCPGEQDPIAVEPLEWQNTRYILEESTGIIHEEVVGSFLQYPLKLAWAITIHKSQGLTFDKVIVDAHAAFAHGQVYVALSRCRTLDGLILSSPIVSSATGTDQLLEHFNRQVQQNEPDQQELLESGISFQKELLDYLFDFRPLQYQLGKLHQQAREYSNSLDASAERAFGELTQLVQKEMVQVSERFGNEMQRLHQPASPPQENPRLQERVQKACSYFLGKLDVAVFPELEKLEIDTDNKEVKKNLQEGLKKVMQLVGIQRACLDACRIGFNVEELLKARALASIEKAPSAGIKSRQAQKQDQPGHPQLLGELRKWRDQKALQEDIPISRILPRRSMVEIATHLPGNMKALAAIHGMGEKKIKKYGEEILMLVQDFCQRNGLESQQQLFDPFREAKPERIPTRQVTLEMFEHGLSPEEIARNRKLSPATIDSHLAEFVSSGQITLERLVSPDKVALISDYFHCSDDYHLGPAKEVLGEGVSYSELRFVLNRFIFTRELEHKDSFREFLNRRGDSNKKND